MARKIADPALKGVVSIHGRLSKPESGNSMDKIRAKVQALHGYADPIVPPEQVHYFLAYFFPVGLITVHADTGL